VLAADAYGYDLADAASLCLRSCPPLLPNDELSWACLYPVDPDGTRNAPQGLSSLSAWAAVEYDYFSQLGAADKASSCALTGPCYPVLWATRLRRGTCQAAQPSGGAPYAPQRVADFRTCLACCAAPPPRAASCVPPAFSYTARSANRSVYNPGDDDQYVGCLQHCQAAHDSIAALAASNSSALSAVAVQLFQAACASAGAQATPVPLPGSFGAQGSLASSLSSLLVSQTAALRNGVAALAAGWRTLLVCGLVLPCALSLLWLAVLRWAAAALVWLSVGGANLALLGATLYCFAKAGRLGDAALLDAAPPSERAVNATLALTLPTADASAAERRQAYGLGIAAAVATCAMLLLTLHLRPRLRLAAAALRVSTGTLGAAPWLALLPLALFLLAAGFLAWWVAAGVFVYAAGDVVPRDCCAQVQAAWATAFAGVNASLVPPSLAAPACADIRCGWEVRPDARLQGALVYHLFSLLWGLAFLDAFGALVTAHTTFEAYLSRVPGAPPPPDAPVAYAARTALSFYLGSLCLGSLLAALSLFAWAPLTLAEGRLRALRAARARQRRCTAALVAAAHRACESALALISKHSAYSMMTVDGQGYAASALAATALLRAHRDTVAPVRLVGSLVCLASRLGVAAGCAFWTFVYLDSSPPDAGAAAPAPLLPVLVVAASSFLTASLFMSVVEVCTETTCVAFADDAQAHGGTALNAPLELAEALAGVEAQKREGYAPCVPLCCRVPQPGDADAEAADAAPGTKMETAL